MSRSSKLAPEVNRALFVKNLSYNVSADDLYDLFGRFGSIRQIRQGIANNTKGTAFVVYEDVMDAKAACDKLNGFNFQNRYLVVLYHQPEKMAKSEANLAERQENLEKLKQEHAQKTADDPDDRTSFKRKDSGMSGMDPSKSPETATPKTRDFATTNTNTTNRNVRNEKHDTNNTKAAVDKSSSKMTPAPASVLGESKHKENLNMLRRMKNMALAPLHIGGGAKA
ncbi:hypothetical protein PRZ48_010968 [Zasmidium cellare]|uniref:RRM domain-containing protein n=1 Tax=Zasmidium cellare TaxID=395010 RepID=A0ABR0EAN7_ZASCE|nr:hypothetical protein PRZ48_010968 [Zasmidium cellare]